MADMVECPGRCAVCGAMRAVSLPADHPAQLSATCPTPQCAGRLSILDDQRSQAEWHAEHVLALHDDVKAFVYDALHASGLRLEAAVARLRLRRRGWR